jgi:hypothetical protein
MGFEESQRLLCPVSGHRLGCLAVVCEARGTEHPGSRPTTGRVGFPQALHSRVVVE